MATEAKPARRRAAVGPTRRNGATSTAATAGSAKRDGRAARSETAIRARLFDGTGKDRDVVVTPALVRELGDRQTLWIDIERPDEAQIERIVDLLDLEPASGAAMRELSGPPKLAMFDEYLQLSVNAIELRARSEETTPLGMLAGRNFVVTVHEEPVACLETFKKQFRGDTRIGLVDGPAFLTALLDSHLTGYFQAIERLELDADRLDQRALHPRSQRDLLSDLVAVRRRISMLRRALVPHREVFAALTRPELSGLGDPEDTTVLRALADRLERAIDSAETARELVLGSFDVHMTRLAQRTNDVMKLLTLVTVILLPGSMIAGIMGMNFKVAFFDDPTWFWIVLAAVVAIAVVTLIVARVKSWI